MKKTKPRAASREKRPRTGAADKKSLSRSARTRPSSQHRVTGRTTVDRDGGIASALNALVEISVEMRDLLVQIRDALVEAGEAEPEAVDTLVIAETEPPQPPEDEL
jgi:hypothetical protein